MSAGGRMSKTNKNSGISTGDFRRAVHEGDVFYETACMCENSFNPSEGKFEFLLPYTVNLSFACEVYLKAIMIHFSKENEFSTGHRLGELFGKLNVDAQKIVREMFEQELKPWNKKLEKFNFDEDESKRFHKKEIEQIRQQQEKEKELFQMLFC